jgi:hypothetical protein
MADASLPARFAENDFRIGRIISRTSSVRQGRHRHRADRGSVRLIERLPSLA